MITYGPCTIAMLKNSKTFPEIYRAYSEECSVAGLPKPDEKLSAYAQLELYDLYWAYGAFDGEDVIGFIATVTPIIPHYGVGITVAESLFVLPEYRPMGVGWKLITAAEKHAKEKGSAGISLSSPAGGRLSEVLSKTDYRLTNEIYFKALQ